MKKKNREKRKEKRERERERVEWKRGERETGAEVRHLSRRTEAGAQAYVTKHCAVLLPHPAVSGKGIPG